MNLPKSLLVTAIAGVGLAISSPADAAIGDLIVVAQNILRITPAGSTSTISSGTAAAIAIDARGAIFVSNTNSDSIQIVAANGSRTTFATGINAISLAFGRNGLLYAGTFSDIVVFAPDGTRATFAELIRANGMAFDSRGNLFVADTNAQAVYKFTPQGVRTTFAANIAGATELAFDAADNLYVSTFTQNGIIKVTPNGTQSIFTTDVFQPLGLAFGPDGLLYVANSGSGTIARFGRSGGAGTIFSSNIAKPEDLVFERPSGLTLNISTRLRVQTGENALIGGFIITGTENKRIIIRALGPSLSSSGVSDALQDPVLELYNSAGGLLTTIDDWKDNNQRPIVEATGVPPRHDREAAGVFTLPPGAYTAAVRGKNNGTGVGLVEVYDLNQAATSQLANISTRGPVETGDNVMIGGFILGGNGARVLLRALGPSLAQAGVAGAMSDPTLSLRNANGVEIDANDNWRERQAEVQATGAAPSDDRESAFVATLGPGNYTAIVAGAGSGTGVGLVELYNLNK